MCASNSRKIKALYAANKYLPDNDYRVLYPFYSAVCSVIYALPRAPKAVDQEHFVKVGFSEGIHFIDLWHFTQFFLYLARNRARLDFAHFYSTVLVLMGPILASLTGLPSVITITGLGRTFTSRQIKYSILRPVYRLSMSLAIQLSQLVLFQNHNDMQTFSKWFPDGTEKYRYAGSAVDSPIIQQKSFSTPVLRVLLVARLLPDKGIRDFLEVANRLYQSSFEFILVGPPSVGFDGLLAEVKKFAANGVISYTGELEGIRLQEEFAKAHILLFPSYGEGMSRVMLEAGFARLCPIAYSIPANQDLIDDGRGFLVPCGDIEQVIRILVKLQDNRMVLEQYAINYQAYITKYYNMVAYAERMDGIITKHLSEK